jgi:hypothetical protein
MPICSSRSLIAASEELVAASLRHSVTNRTQRDASMPWDVEEAASHCYDWLHEEDFVAGRRRESSGGMWHQEARRVNQPETGRRENLVGKHTDMMQK